MSNEKIRCFVIADDYRWHILSDNPEEFLQYTKAYLELMNTSKKENHYYFKNVFLTKDEFRQIKKNISYQTENIIDFKETKKNKRKECHLRLVE